MAGRSVVIHNGGMLDTDIGTTGSSAPLGCETGAGCYAPDYLESHTFEAIQYWVQRAERFAAQLGRGPLQIPRLAFDLRGMNAGEFVAGRRRYGGPCIRINRELLHRYPRHMIQQVIPHEVAHYVVWATQRRRTQPHGREWRAVMQYFGKPADVSHRMDVRPARRVRKLPFTCGCNASQHYSTVILKRHLAGTRYFCRRCGERLLPSHEALSAVAPGR